VARKVARLANHGPEHPSEQLPEEPAEMAAGLEVRGEAVEPDLRAELAAVRATGLAETALAAPALGSGLAETALSRVGR
jgi:hypothetical protein